MISRTAACAVTAVLALLLLAAGPAAAQPAGPAPVRPDGHVALAWLSGGSSDDYRAQVEAMPGVSVVSPTWWGLDSGDPGALTDAADPEFVSWAHARGVAVWPQLGNRLDAAVSDAVLGDPGRRARLVDETARAVGRAGADGVVVSFENLREQTGPALTAFVAELRAALGGRAVAVTVAPQTDTWSLGSWSTSYERRALGEVADYVVLTALDQHRGVTPGPVAGLEWTLHAVEHLLRTVPDRKVLLALPLYARDWVVDPPEDPAAVHDAVAHDTLGMVAMARRLDDVGATHEFDAAAGQRRYTYRDPDGRLHWVWQEDPASLARRAELATAYNLGGVASWRGGFAGPRAFIAVSSVLAANPRPAGPQSGPPRLNPLVPAPRLADPESGDEPPAAGPHTVVEAAGGESGPSGGGAAAVAAAVLVAVTAAGVALHARGLSGRRAAGRARR